MSCNQNHVFHTHARALNMGERQSERASEMEQVSMGLEIERVRYSHNKWREIARNDSFVKMLCGCERHYALVFLCMGPKHVVNVELSRGRSSNSSSSSISISSHSKSIQLFHIVYRIKYSINVLFQTKTCEHLLSFWIEITGCECTTHTHTHDQSGSSKIKNDEQEERDLRQRMKQTGSSYRT